MSVSSPDVRTVCYSVAAAVDAGVLPRLLNQIAKTGLVPDRLHSMVQEDEMTVDLQIRDLPPSRAALLEERFRAVIGVHWVARSAKVVEPGAGFFG